MKKFVLLIGLFGLSGIVYGQRTEVKVELKDLNNRGSEPVEPSPQYPGGIGAYLSKHQRYPEQARQNQVKGMVLVNFQIDSRGYIQDSTIRVIKGIGYGCDEEALRLIRNMSRWKPGKVSGKSVSVNYNIPVLFPPKP
ncbi:energy transducer TonB [Larkinella arboricola]